jgi:hypothetical protein
VATSPESAPHVAGGLHIDSGVCYALFAYDVGFAVDLDAAERRIQAATQRESIRRTRKAPQYFQYHPPPLRTTTSAESVAIAGHATDSALDFVIYDFGVVTVIYRIPLAGPLTTLQRLAVELYDNEPLLNDSRRRVEQLLQVIGPVVSKLHLAEVVEDYVVFQITDCSPVDVAQRAIADLAQPLAQLLRAESAALSAEEIEDSLSCRISFGTRDLMIIDWNAAVLIGAEMEDEWAVLEFANVELLEMRFLDDQLDAALTDAYHQFTGRQRSQWWRLRPRAAARERVARLQLDSVILFEEVNNTLKLLGDPYLSRVYRLAAQRFHLADWDESILRKLKTVEGIYEKLTDQHNALRLEILEWIIIALIALSIVLSLK